MSSTIKVGLSTEMETEQQHFERLYATMKAKKETKDEEIAKIKREIEIEQQETSNEQEQLAQVKEDLRKALI